MKKCSHSDLARPGCRFRAQIFRPEDFAKLTTPSAVASVASRLLIDAAATLLCEEGIDD